MSLIKEKKSYLEKKIVLILFTLIVFIRILYVFANNDIEKEYVTSYVPRNMDMEEIPCEDISTAFISDEKYLNSVELLFTGIEDDKTDHITLKILDGESIVYQTKISLKNIENLQWKKIYINAELTKAEYIINLTASDNCNKVPRVFITKDTNSAPENLATYNKGELIEGELAIQYGYLKSPSLLEKVAYSTKWVVGYIVGCILIICFDKIKKEVIKLYGRFSKYKILDSLIIVAELFAYRILTIYSETFYGRDAKICLLIITLLCVYKFREKTQYIYEKSFSKKNIGWLVVLYIYSAFSLEGLRCFIFPLDLKSNINGMILFILAAIWFVPIINTMIYGLEYLTNRYAFSTKEGMSNTRFVIISLLILLIPAFFNLYANNPGITSPDSYTCMITNAHNLKGMTDWHPAFYCMMLNLILKVWDSTYAIILVHYFFWCFVVIELFLYLKKKGVRENVLLTGMFFFGLNPANYIHLNTIWKDIPYTISIFWSVIILAKLLIDFDEYKKKKFIYVELVASLVGIFFYRKNGIVPFILIVMAVLIVLRKNWKIWMAIITTFLIIGIIKGPVYHNLDIQSTGQRGMYIGLGQDILGVYYAGGEISQETLEMINTMTYANNAEYDYTPTWSNQSYDLYVEPLKFIRNYLDTFIRNPITMIRAIVAREDAVWDIFGDDRLVLGCVNFIETQDGIGEWNNYYPRRKQNWLTNPMITMTMKIAKNQITGSIFWRGGVSTLLGIVVIVYLFCRKGMKKNWIIIVPVVGHLLSLLLSTGWSDFRYFWPMNLMFTAIVFLTMIICRKENK